jgi:hypothetical protein
MKVLRSTTIGRFREVRDEIEQKIKGWLEHPEEELARLKAERERERRERAEAVRREADERLQQMAASTTATNTKNTTIGTKPLPLEARSL